MWPWNWLDALSLLPLWRGAFSWSVPTEERHCYLWPQLSPSLGREAHSMAWTRRKCDVASSGQQGMLLTQCCQLLVQVAGSLGPSPAYNPSLLISQIFPPCALYTSHWHAPLAWALSSCACSRRASFPWFGSKHKTVGLCFGREGVPCSLWLLAEAGGMKSP